MAVVAASMPTCTHLVRAQTENRGSTNYIIFLFAEGNGVARVRWRSPLIKRKGANRDPAEEGKFFESLNEGGWISIFAQELHKSDDSAEKKRKRDADRDGLGERRPDAERQERKAVTAGKHQRGHAQSKVMDGRAGAREEAGRPSGLCDRALITHTEKFLKKRCGGEQQG